MRGRGPRARWLLGALVAGAGLTSSCDRAGRFAATTNGTIMTLEELIQAARRGPARAFPTETLQSQPVPGRTARRVTVRFMSGPQRAQPGSIDYFRPTHLAELDVRSGELVAVHEWPEAAHVGGGAPGAPIGSFSLPPGVTVQEFLALRARYHAAIDRVLPTYAAQSAPGPEVVAAAHQIKDLTPRVLETPLLPFYRAVGADFFAWIDQTAQP